MKPIFYITLLALFFTACGSMPSIQKVESKIPCIGAVGEDRSTLFKKEFQKVGEPTLAKPIGATLNSYAFDKNSYSKYVNYAKNLGRQPKVMYTDSMDVKPRFYTLTITNLVGLQAELNHIANKALKEYMATDDDLKLLHEISFVATANLKEVINQARHFYIIETKEGLMLEVHDAMGNATIQMNTFEVFDFDTAGICWTKNQFGNYEVASFLVDDRSCPGNTEKDPHKLDDVANYLKF